MASQTTCDDNADLLCYTAPIAAFELMLSMLASSHHSEITFVVK
jgi:hypothetical protein